MTAAENSGGKETGSRKPNVKESLQPSQQGALLALHAIMRFGDQAYERWQQAIEQIVPIERTRTGKTDSHREAEVVDVMGEAVVSYAQKTTDKEKEEVLEVFLHKFGVEETRRDEVERIFQVAVVAQKDLTRAQLLDREFTCILTNDGGIPIGEKESERNAEKKVEKAAAQGEKLWHALEGEEQPFAIGYIEDADIPVLEELAQATSLTNFSRTLGSNFTSSTVIRIQEALVGGIGDIQEYSTALQAPHPAVRAIAVLQSMMDPTSPTTYVQLETTIQDEVYSAIDRLRAELYLEAIKDLYSQVQKKKAASGSRQTPDPRALADMPTVPNLPVPPTQKGSRSSPVVPLPVPDGSFPPEPSASGERVSALAVVEEEQRKKAQEAYNQWVQLTDEQRKAFVLVYTAPQVDLLRDIDYHAMEDTLSALPLLRETLQVPQENFDRKWTQANAGGIITGVREFSESLFTPFTNDFIGSSEQLLAPDQGANLEAFVTKMIHHAPIGFVTAEAKQYVDEWLQSRGAPKITDNHKPIFEIIMQIAWNFGNNPEEEHVTMLLDRLEDRITNVSKATSQVTPPASRAVSPGQDVNRPGWLDEAFPLPDGSTSPLSATAAGQIPGEPAQPAQNAGKSEPALGGSTPDADLFGRSTPGADSGVFPSLFEASVPGQAQRTLAQELIPQTPDTLKIFAAVVAGERPLEGMNADDFLVAFRRYADNNAISVLGFVPANDIDGIRAFFSKVITPSPSNEGQEKPEDRVSALKERINAYLKQTGRRVAMRDFDPKDGEFLLKIASLFPRVDEFVQQQERETLQRESGLEAELMQQSRQTEGQLYQLTHNLILQAIYSEFPIEKEALRQLRETQYEDLAEQLSTNIREGATQWKDISAGIKGSTFGALPGYIEALARDYQEIYYERFFEPTARKLVDSYIQYKEDAHNLSEVRSSPDPSVRAGVPHLQKEFEEEGIRIFDLAKAIARRMGYTDAQMRKQLGLYNEILPDDGESDIKANNFLKYVVNEVQKRMGWNDAQISNPRSPTQKGGSDKGEAWLVDAKGQSNGQSIQSSSSGATSGLPTSAQEAQSADFLASELPAALDTQQIAEQLQALLGLENPSLEAREEIDMQAQFIHDVVQKVSSADRLGAAATLMESVQRYAEKIKAINSNGQSSNSDSSLSDKVDAITALISRISAVLKEQFNMEMNHKVDALISTLNRLLEPQTSQSASHSLPVVNQPNVVSGQSGTEREHVRPISGLEDFAAVRAFQIETGSSSLESAVLESAVKELQEQARRQFQILSPDQLKVAGAFLVDIEQVINTGLSGIDGRQIYSTTQPLNELIVENRYQELIAHAMQVVPGIQQNFTDNQTARERLREIATDYIYARVRLVQRFPVERQRLVALPATTAIPALSEREKPRDWKPPVEIVELALDPRSNGVELHTRLYRYIAQQATELLQRQITEVEVGQFFTYLRQNMPFNDAIRNVFGSRNSEDFQRNLARMKGVDTYLEQILTGRREAANIYREDTRQVRIKPYEVIGDVRYALDLRNEFATEAAAREFVQQSYLRFDLAFSVLIGKRFPLADVKDMMVRMTAAIDTARKSGQSVTTEVLVETAREALMYFDANYNKYVVGTEGSAQQYLYEFVSDYVRQETLLREQLNRIKVEGKHRKFYRKPGEPPGAGAVAIVIMPTMRQALEVLELSSQLPPPENRPDPGGPSVVEIRELVRFSTNFDQAVDDAKFTESKLQRLGVELTTEITAETLDTLPQEALKLLLGIQSKHIIFGFTDTSEQAGVINRALTHNNAAIGLTAPDILFLSETDSQTMQAILQDKETQKAVVLLVNAVLGKIRGLTTNKEAIRDQFQESLPMPWALTLNRNQSEEDITRFGQAVNIEGTAGVLYEYKEGSNDFLLLPPAMRAWVRQQSKELSDPQVRTQGFLNAMEADFKHVLRETLPQSSSDWQHEKVRQFPIQQILMYLSGQVPRQDVLQEMMQGLEIENNQQRALVSEMLDQVLQAANFANLYIGYIHAKHL